MTVPVPPPHRRQRRIADPRRFGTFVGIALAALVAGIVVGALHVPSERRIGTAYASAWAHQDYGAMYALLSDAAQARTSRARFRRAYARAADTLTLEHVETGRVREDGHAAKVDVTL